MAHRHNSKLAPNEPPWGEVDKTALPRNAHAEQGEEGKKSTWGYPHHHIVGGTKKDNDGIWTDGEMYLHKGGLNAAWSAAQGARSGQKSSQGVIDHLQAHRRAIGIEDDEGTQASSSAIPIGIHFLPHIAARVFNTPLMITPERLDMIIQALGPRIGLMIEKNALVDMSIPKRRRPDSGNDGIALIPIHNTLVYRQFGEMQPTSGHLTSYEEIRAWFAEANQDPAIHTILYDVESPGGEVSGVFDLVDFIMDTKQKPIYAAVNEYAYSAAYAIASTADKIFVPRTGGLGSVGVIALHMDRSGRNEREGVRYTPIYAGAHKNDFSPDQPLSAEAYRIASEQVNEIYNLFTKTVARNRQMSQRAVRTTEAGVFQGQKAVDIGFADEIKSISEVIEIINQNNSKRRTKSMAVKAEEQTTQTMSQAEIEKVKAEAAAEARKEAIEQEKVRVAGIRNACGAVKHLIDPGLADQLISDGVTLADANQRIIEHLAKRSEESQVRSNVGALSDGQKNSLIEDAKRRQQAAGQRGPLV